MQDTETLPTVASISEQRRAQAQAQARIPQSAEHPQVDKIAAHAAPDAEQPVPGSPEELEAEAGQEGAFNEETGEINWDCPCLGGMAHGPCGEQFREAFSCFVFSKAEPKGVDCIEHFKAMQNCFREHPDIYGGELDDDESEGEEQSDLPEAEVAPSSRELQAPVAAVGPPPSQSVSVEVEQQRQRAQAAGDQVKRDHGEQGAEYGMSPKASHDARESN